MKLYIFILIDTFKMHSCIVCEFVYIQSVFELTELKVKGHRRTQSEKSSHSTYACCLYQLRAHDAGHFITYKQVSVCIRVVFSLSFFLHKCI